MPPPSSRSASPAADIAAALGARAEAVCRRYLPQGKKQGRYWVAGDLEGARGRSLFVRLHGPGVPGKWTDAATGEHGDLLDLVRHRSGAPTLRAALAEARAFLALPAPPASGESYDATEAARRLWRRCRAIDGTHAEAYLRARGLARCRFPALRFHPELRYREGSSLRRFPALVAAVTGDDGAIQGVQRTWLDPRLPAKADVAAPRKALGRIHGRAVRFGRPADGASLLVGEGIETVLSIVTAAPGVISAAALSAGSLGAFAPPGGVARLVIARDNDSEGERAAQRLARRCARAGVAAHVIVSEYGDFNDDLVHSRTPGPGPSARRPVPRAAAGRREGGKSGGGVNGSKGESEHGAHRQSQACARPAGGARRKAEHGGTVRIDRRSQWGNRFRIGPDGPRDEVIARYRADLWRRIRAAEVGLDELAALHGKPLACWCAPLPCHGQVLARAAAWAASVLAERRGE